MSIDGCRTTRPKDNSPQLKLSQRKLAQHSQDNSESESEYFTDDTSINIHSPGPTRIQSSHLEYNSPQTDNKWRVTSKIFWSVSDTTEYNQGNSFPYKHQPVAFQVGLGKLYLIFCWEGLEAVYGFFSGKLHAVVRLFFFKLWTSNPYINLGTTYFFHMSVLVYCLRPGFPWNLVPIRK